MNIEFPPGMLVGYELEFCSNRYISQLDTLPIHDWFEFGVDRSLKPRNDAAHMYEIRSKTPMNTVSVDVIQLTLEYLDTLRPFWHSNDTKKNIFTTRNCGLHVHISWEDKRMAHILFGHLANVLATRVKPFDERRDYCSPNFDSTRGVRYNAIRWVDIPYGHFEVRLFNGTMKLRGIVNCLKMIRNEALLVARASQAANRTQSANSIVDLWGPAMG